MSCLLIFLRYCCLYGEKLIKVCDAEDEELGS